MKKFIFIFTLLIILTLKSPYYFAKEFNNNNKENEIFNKKISLSDLIVSAENGNEKAQFNLGQIFYWGIGVSQNYFEAFKWYTLSAEQGSSEAQYALGNIYGLLDKCFKEEFIYMYMWWSIASKNGNEKAERGLKMIEKAMTYDQIERSKKLAKSCLESNYKDC